MLASQTISEHKAAVRARVKCLGKLHNDDERQSASQKIVHALRKWCVLANATYVIAYDAIGDEPNLAPLVSGLVAVGAKVALPRYCSTGYGYEIAAIVDPETDLVPGRYGIREPRSDLPTLPRESQDAVDTLWLVPGVTFDQAGVRLGRGIGYYDRMMSTACGVKAGVVYQWAVQNWLAHEEHDVGMDWLVTEETIKQCALCSRKQSREERM